VNGYEGEIKVLTGKNNINVQGDKYKRLRSQIRSRRRRGLSAKQLLERKINMRRATQSQSRTVTTTATRLRRPNAFEYKQPVFA